MTIADAIIVFLLVSIILLGFIFRWKYKALKEKIETENIRLASENRELETSRIISQLQHNHYKLELAHKKRELASLVLYLSSKNEILTNIKNSLQKPKFQKENEPIISTIVTEIDSNLNLDKDWISFKLHFEEIHPDFFKSLMKRFPDLSHEELKLCAYLRINLSSKEIAQLLNITPASVNKRRNRIRKKIHIDPELGLYEFISGV